MIDKPIERKIKYEGELDHQFARNISKMPGGEHLYSCIQCGTCSATCPLSIYMDYTPRRIVAMTRAGFKEEVLSSFTIWLCASCYSCTVECPKNIKITDVMYALKQNAIQSGAYSRRFAIPVLAREFFSLILKSGRNSESRLLSRLYAKTNPMKFLTRGFMGLRLWLQGRLKMGAESIKNREQLRTILNSIDNANDREYGQNVNQPK